MDSPSAPDDEGTVVVLQVPDVVVPGAAAVADFVATVTPETPG
jgi:hypothetical protein